MTQGIFVNGRRPNSKKAVKEAVASDASSVWAEATSWHGDEYDGPVTDMPEGGRGISFVGPDPYTSRRFYGTIKRVGDRITVT
jgi:hypothetical protein